MPATSDAGSPLTPAQLTGRLTALIHGPYADADTAGGADLAAEAIRYLNYAAPGGGITDPATTATVAASLAIAASRLPQLLAALEQWLTAEAAAGRIADDHHRPPADLAGRIRAVMSQAAGHADDLTAALSTAHNLTATLHAADPAA